MLDFLLIYSDNNLPLSPAVLDSFINKQISDCSFDYSQAYYFFSEYKDRFALFCSTDVDSHLIRTNNSIDFFDGIIIQDEVCIDIRTLKPILHGNINDHSEVFGNYCYGHYSGQGVNHIHGTVLGQYPLFIGFSEKFTAISNNPRLTAQAIHGSNYKEHKNIGALGWLLSTHCIMDLSTTYDSVYRFPQNAGLLIDAGNAVSFFSLCDNLYYPMDQNEWTNILDKTYPQLINFLSYYHSKGLEYGIGAEITGGFDSRVTLALAIQAGIHKKINWTVFGYKNHPDVIIAESIAREFGLTLNWHPPKELSLNEIEASFNESLIGLHKTAGMTQYSEVWKVDNKRFSFMITGIAGEMFRSYHSTHLAEEGYSNKLIDDTDREFLFDRTLNFSKNCLNPDVVNYYHDRLINVFKTFEELYSCDLVPCRTHQLQFHGGLYLRSLSPHICCIGFNPWLHRLSMIEAPESRASNDIAFKIIARSVPELLYFPLDGEKWSYLAYSDSKHAKIIDKVKPYMTNIPGQTAIHFPKQTKILFENHNIGIHDSVYQIFNKNYIERLILDSKNIANGSKAVDKNVLARTIDIMGASIFLNNQDISPVSSHANLSIDGKFLQNHVKESPAIYNPPYQIYKEPAKQVIDNAELCFQKNKVYHSSDHNTLPIEIQRNFASKMKRNTITIKGRIKEFVPSGVLKIYHAFRNKY